MIPEQRLREIAEANARECERLTDVLRRNGFRKCDVMACNCGSWHQVDGYAARFREIDDAVGDHNGKTLLAAVQELVAERDRYHDALVARHGGEPVALLSELDAAREEIEDLRVSNSNLIAEALKRDTLLSELDAARAENERLAKQRDELARWIVLRGQPHRDGACSHCYPKHVAPGFVCAFHVAEAIAAEQPKPAGGGA